MSSGSLSHEVRATLLALARAAIGARLTGQGTAPAPSAAPELAERRGAFVTLRRRADGGLRGCVGIAEPRLPLRDAVVEAATAAAFQDTRFAPVERGELDGLQVVLSVLGPLRPADPAGVVPGVHGVLLRHGGRSGLLLPQVAEEHGWDRETLLAGACGKAGIPPASWRDPGCALWIFTTESFAEPARGDPEG